MYVNYYRCIYAQLNRSFAELTKYISIYVIYATLYRAIFMFDKMNEI